MNRPRSAAAPWGRFCCLLEALPLGELASECETERARTLSRNKKHSDNINSDKSRCLSLCRYSSKTGLPSPSRLCRATARVAALSIRSASLASCWPRPQQRLPVSATGGGRRRCSYRGEALTFRQAFSLRQRLPSVGATTRTCRANARLRG